MRSKGIYTDMVRGTLLINDAYKLNHQMTEYFCGVSWKGMNFLSILMEYLKLFQAIKIKHTEINREC